MTTTQLPAHLLPILRFVVIYEVDGTTYREPFPTRSQAAYRIKVLDEENGITASYRKV